MTNREIKLPNHPKGPKPREPREVDHELVIPDDEAYAKYPVSATDDEEVLLLKYRRAQIDMMFRLTKTSTAEELKKVMNTPATAKLVKDHNTKMLRNLQHAKKA